MMPFSSTLSRYISSTKTHPVSILQKLPESCPPHSCPQWTSASAAASDKLQGLVKYRVDEVAKFDGNCIELKVGGRLNADILVIARKPISPRSAANQGRQSSRCVSNAERPCLSLAVGHEVQDKPAFLQGLQLRKFSPCLWPSAN